jgi:putative oxidoreductase
MGGQNGSGSIFAPWVLGILRIVAAALFMQHGLQKFFAIPAPPGPSGTVALLSLMGLAGTLELFGGFLVLIGLFTRPVSFVLSGEMALAYFMRHASHGLWPVLNHGELAALYCFIFLYLAAAGGGSWSMDRLRSGTG